MIEEIGRYIDGTLQDDGVHPCDVEFTRVTGSGRMADGGFECDFDVLLQGRPARITLSVRPASEPAEPQPQDQQVERDQSREAP